MADGSSTTGPAGVGAVGRVAVIGGGIAGLASAHFLADAGARVTVYESTDQLGGLGTFFPWRNRFLERFYHCMLPTDDDLLALLSAIGVREHVYWKPTGFGFMRRGRVYPLNSPRDLLRFDVLPLLDRLRVGATGLRGRLVSDRGLDDVTCAQWLTRMSGARAFSTFWKPMLEAKFGDRWQDVPALWFWTRFNREKGSNREEKGHIRGGYKRISDALAERLRRRGHEIRLRTPVASLDLDPDGRPIVVPASAPPETFDRLVYTAPVIHLRTSAVGRLAESARGIDASIDMQGVINVVLLLKRGFTPFYWVAAIDEEIPFQGIVESTTLIERQELDGLHLVYLMKYVHRTDPIFALDDAEILRSYLAGLRRLFPDFGEADVVDRFVFRTPFVEPLYTRGYLGRRPPDVLVPRRVYLATSTQVYPGVTSWNGSTGLARRVTRSLLEQVRG